MSFIDSFERKFLFGLTRFLSLLIISCLLFVIMVGGIMVSGKFFSKNDMKVTPTEVLTAIKTPVKTESQPQPDQQQPKSKINVILGIKIPISLQKYISEPRHVEILKGWLEEVPTKNRQEFVNELVEVIVEAEKTDTTNIAAVIDKYKDLKFNKIKDFGRANNEIDTSRLLYLGVAFACLTLIALFSLILVLLAIERNTRKGAVPPST